jgi:hypothetical protein
LTRAQLARRHQTTPETIIRREKEGLLKPLKLGRQVRFRLSDILEFERASERSASASPAKEAR